MRVRYDSRAVEQIAAIECWIGERADQDTATQVVNDILYRCKTLENFPSRGTPRPDIHPRLRTIPHRRRYTIGYMVYPDEVVVVAVRSAGQDWNSVFGPES